MNEIVKKAIMENLAIRREYYKKKIEEADTHSRKEYYIGKLDLTEELEKVILRGNLIPPEHMLRTLGMEVPK